jgi:hypothetical protein
VALTLLNAIKYFILKNGAKFTGTNS